MTRRYALYYAPSPSHPLWRAGCDWLGRDAESGASSIANSGAVASQRGAPRRYGFHATLKPPFALREGVDESALDARLAAFSSERAGFVMPCLHVAELGDFLALRPSAGAAAAEVAPLHALANDCVRRFDDLRRPATAADITRRSTAMLKPTQRANLERWGYPYVFESWRFHMTLTDALQRDDGDDAHRRAWLADATRHFAAALTTPLRCDGVALFVEDEPGADFRLARRYGFAR